MPTPRDELARAIARWEGTWQAQPQDAGNYVTMPDGSRRLIGTMRGVTPAALAAHKGVPPYTITEADMRAITPEIAADIGETKYYRGTGLDMLAWGPATAALVDFGWGSGPGQAVKSMQRLCGATADGVVGPRTVEAYAKWVNGLGWEQATRAVKDMRIAFYDLIISRNPAWEMYRKGWHNRANWMTPESAEWWGPWKADMAPMPPVPDTYSGGLPKPTEPAPVVPPKPARDPEAAAGKKVAGATAAAGAAAPIIQAWLSAHWEQAAVFGAVIVILAGLAFWHFHRRDKRKQAEAAVGI